MPELNEKARLVADRYEEAFYRANGKEVSVVCTSPGWYNTRYPGTPLHAIKGRYRLSEIGVMAKRLEEIADEKEKAVKREGFIITIAPPATRKYRDQKPRYLTTSKIHYGWTMFRDSSEVHVFETSREADEVAHQINERLPFKYAEIEPF